MLAYQPVRSLATLNISVNQGLVGAKRVLPIIDEKSSLRENPNDKNINLNQGNIFFKNVNFKFDSQNEDTLNSINLDIKGGKMTSLVGHSGAGKSTILNLIPRFYDCKSGDIIL